MTIVEKSNSETLAKAVAQAEPNFTVEGMKQLSPFVARLACFLEHQGQHVCVLAFSHLVGRQCLSIKAAWPWCNALFTLQARRPFFLVLAEVDILSFSMVADAASANHKVARTAFKDLPNNILATSIDCLVHQVAIVPRTVPGPQVAYLSAKRAQSFE